LTIDLIQKPYLFNIQEAVYTTRLKLR